MTLNAKDAPGGGNRPPALEAGTYPGRLVGLITLGLQPQRPYMGAEKPPAQEIMLTYEFSDEFLLDEDGEEIKDKPRWLSETLPFYNLSSEKAKITKRYLALDPNLEHDGDWSALVSSPCMITLTNTEGKKGKNKGRIYENVAAISAMREKDAAKLPPLVNEPRIFDWENPDMDVWKKLPKWIQDKIKENLEFNGSPLQTVLDGAPAEDSKSQTEAEGDDTEADEQPW